MNRYHEELGGVVLAIRKLRVNAAPKRVLYDSPYLHIHVTADVLLFAPQIRMQLGIDSYSVRQLSMMFVLCRWSGEFCGLDTHWAVVAWDSEYNNTCRPPAR